MRRDGTSITQTTATTDTFPLAFKTRFCSVQVTTGYIGTLNAFSGNTTKTTLTANNAPVPGVSSTKIGYQFFAIGY